MKISLFLKRLREKKFILPPLTGFTDYPYRKILADFNPPFITTEMINAKALLHNNQRTIQMIKQVSSKHIQGVQLLGKDPESMAKAAKIIQDHRFDYIDINMGCTIAKVTTRGEGVSLMSDEQNACAVVNSVVKVVDLPVTVKLRTGISKKAINVTSLSKKLVDNGATALTVHGRTGEKKFSFNIDISAINDVVRHVSVPVIANGGIFNGEDAKDILYKTEAVAVMPGRGLIGNPWIVTEISCAFSGKSYLPPNLEEKKKICIKHTKEICEHYGERKGIILMRKILPKYFSSTLFIKELKHDVQHIKDKNDLSIILARIIERDSKWYYERNNYKYTF
jgi:tRNA-dihydrouridine synthase B